MDNHGKYQLNFLLRDSFIVECSRDSTGYSSFYVGVHVFITKFTSHGSVRGREETKYSETK